MARGRPLLQTAVGHPKPPPTRRRRWFVVYGGHPPLPSPPPAPMTFLFPHPLIFALVYLGFSLGGAAARVFQGLGQVRRPAMQRRVLPSGPRLGGAALAFLLAFGSAKTWQSDFHRLSNVPCPAHTSGSAAPARGRPLQPTVSCHSARKSELRRIFVKHERIEI